MADRIEFVDRDYCRAIGIKLSDVSFWRMEKAGRFPKSVTIGGRKKGYVKAEVDAYIAELASRARETKAGAR